MERMFSTGSSAYDLYESLESSAVVQSPVPEMSQSYHSCFEDSSEFGHGDFGGVCAFFAGDPYAQSDDVTRGVDPLALLPPGVPAPPVWADFPGFGGEDVIGGRGLPFMAEKQAKLLGQQQQPRKEAEFLPPPPELGLQQQLGLEPQKQAPSTTKIVNFESSPGPLKPPAPPASSSFALRETSLYVRASGVELGDRLVEFFQHEDQENTSLLGLKTNREKFTLKARIAGRQSLKELMVKLRMYSLPAGEGAEEKACVCIEFQRRYGDAFEFGALYRRAMGFLERSCRIPTGSSRQELFSATGFSSASSSTARARADTSAAQEAMTTAVLSLPAEASAEEQEAGLEFLLHQAAHSELDLQNSTETAVGLALLAREADQEGAVMLLGRLMEGLNSIEDEKENLSPLLALLENAVGMKASSLTYPLVCLIEALFREPRCAELLWSHPAAPMVLEKITGLLAAEEGAVPEASLAKLSSAVRDICAAFGADGVTVDERVIGEVRELLQWCAESHFHWCSVVVRGNLEEAMNQLPPPCCS